MPTFSPPVDALVAPIYIGPGLGQQNDEFYPVDPLMHRLFRHYANRDRGRNVFLMSDGTLRDSQVDGTPPNMIQPPTDPFATSFDSTSGEERTTRFFEVPYVVRTFYGGSANEVNDEEAAILTAAGYVVDP